MSFETDTFKTDKILSGLTAKQWRALGPLIDVLVERFMDTEDRIDALEAAAGIKAVKPRVRAMGVASVPTPPDRDALLAKIRGTLAAVPVES
ncbi:hypothetical protein C7416_103583 [Cupriavidus phytorum]|uniref:Uncharacterized protein n=1 Tax=Cupriavidus phytorum TaxID=3024399 RepID=A0A2W7PA66_9BURK|nr:hypothetical protein [Cupriavidus alkaliphilus]PZX30850.1 hypothetical protein C7416_103583 [Cupriavidus alkaliphilus]